MHTVDWTVTVNRNNGKDAFSMLTSVMGLVVIGL